MAAIHKITPCLWFNFNAEEAVNFYVGLFDNSRVVEVSRYPDSMPNHAGKVMMIDFVLDGQPMLALNGGPEFKFTEAISLSVSCKDQAEVDRLWARLTADGGKEVQCGWLKDRYGLFWQITPEELMRLVKGPDRPKAARVFKAMMGMVKIDIATLRQAAEGKAA
jgi:predicted 3-demethylubiquinone-9 3-methyltransferase (glyoxalase superfamily)